MQYLDAMGIDMFVPRWRLPQAKASQVVPVGPALPETVAALATQELPARVTTDKSERLGEGLAQVSQVASKLVSEVAENDNREALTTPTPEVSTEIQPSENEAVHFSLEIWQPSGMLALDSHQPSSGLPTAALLFNVMRVFGYNTSVLPGSELIHWPMVDLPHKPKSLQAAREMMVPLLDAKLLRAERGVLLFGKDVFRVIASDEDISCGYAERCFQVVELSFARRALVLPSLAEILRKPQLKPLVWRAMQQLLQA